MPFFSRFKKRWAATGVVAEPTDNQSDTGFAYLGTNPPTVEQFNAIFQNLDGKDNWLFSQLEAVILAGGGTPTENNLNSLLNALRSITVKGMQVYTYDRSGEQFVVPSAVTHIRVRMVGAGGGGTGNANFQSGAGGGGGEYREGLFNVTPNSAILVTVGKGGVQLQRGGSSSFGSFMTAVGGEPGNTFLGSSPGGGGGIGGSGGFLAIIGGDGGDGQSGTNTSHLLVGGNGGASYFGGGGRSFRGNMINGRAYGSGGGGAYGPLPVNGGNGADGVVIVEW